MTDSHNSVAKLDFPSGPNERTRLLNHSISIESLEDHEPQSARSGRFFEHVAEGIQERERQRFKVEVVRWMSFIWALVCSGCAGSITTYSLYGHLFQTRLGYSQYQVNIVAVIAEIATYLPIPIFGFCIDHYSPRPTLLLSAVSFTFGYIIAAFTYQSGPPREIAGGNGWPFAVMVLAFIGIGMGTSCMHLSAMAICAKNFTKSKLKGVALAAPIAAFGLSGLWQSQVGSRLLHEKNVDGSAGSLDVFRYFIFLGCLLGGVGLVGSLVMSVVNEEELIEEAIEDLERSGLLGDNEIFRTHSREASYGTIGQPNDTSEPDAGEDSKRMAEENALRKSLLLKSETKLFLTDRTMWLLTIGFYLVTGPGEAFINNLGTMIGALYPPPHETLQNLSNMRETTPATHVSIVALMSTIARLMSGALSDLFAPTATFNQHRRGPTSLTSSLASLDPLADSHLIPRRYRFVISRMTLLLMSSMLMSLGALLLASKAVQNHAADRFWLVSALFGLGYGSAFSLVPIMVSCIWGVENFGTNLGFVIMTPAFGAATWGAIYSAEYESGSKHGNTHDWGDKCYGYDCYRITAWTMAAAIWIACILWVMAWRGPGGWKKKDILI